MQILANYYSYLERNPDSLLCRYLGLYRIQPRKCYVVVTANVLSSTRKIDKVLAACMLSRECLGLIRVAEPCPRIDRIDRLALLAVEV